MEITLTRIDKQAGYTMGCMEADGEYVCDTLEPAWRDVGPGRPGVKIPGRTAIPEGRYPAVITWSPRFRAWLPLLLHVPMFEGIRIHAGNTPDDTAGCILPGVSRSPGRVSESAAAVQRIKNLIVRAKQRGEGVWIRIE
ncbi:hypothetical protein EVD32_07445 [Bacteroidales bacterium SW299]|nr:hypothetical protein [Bacteroidales bacterium SW299]